MEKNVLSAASSWIFHVRFACPGHRNESVGEMRVLCDQRTG